MLQPVLRVLLLSNSQQLSEFACLNQDRAEKVPLLAHPFLQHILHITSNLGMKRLGTFVSSHYL